MHDMTAFRVVYGFGAFSYVIMIVFPESDVMTYIAVVLMVTCIGCWDNISLLIIELRVPPNNVAAVSLMIRTISVSLGIFAPTISSLPEPYPYVVSLCAATFGLLASLNLPAPGLHLNAVE